MTIESRCGILCSECEYREKTNCGGCANIDKPFWGESCPVKSCCENKKLEHCGQCGDFPCDLLNQFSYDKEHGDDGKRIEQCRKWMGAFRVNKKYICYCGLYCENCAVMARVAPASKVLYDEMLKAGFEEVIQFIPGGDGFWPFLKGMAENGICDSCKGDRCGNPDCAVRLCAMGKGVEMCALCEEYPCEKFDNLTVLSSVMRQDNALLREQGMDAWAKLQDERLKGGYTYQDEKRAQSAE